MKVSASKECTEGAAQLQLRGEGVLGVDAPCRHVTWADPAGLDEAIEPPWSFLHVVFVIVKGRDVLSSCASTTPRRPLSHRTVQHSSVAPRLVAHRRKTNKPRPWARHAPLPPRLRQPALPFPQRRCLCRAAALPLRPRGIPNRTRQAAHPARVWVGRRNHPTTPSA